MPRHMLTRLSFRKLSKSPARRMQEVTTRIKSNVVEDHFDRSEYFSVSKRKNRPRTHTLGNLLRTTVDHKTLKILSRGVKLCLRNAASKSELESAELFDLQPMPVFYFGQGQSNSY